MQALLCWVQEYINSSFSFWYMASKSTHSFLMEQAFFFETGDSILTDKGATNFMPWF